MAQTSVLGLPVGAKLCYGLDFKNVTFNGEDQDLASFAMQATEHTEHVVGRTDLGTNALRKQGPSRRGRLAA